MKRFKTYLENRISLLNADLEKLMKRIDSLPPETEIIIENYGDISELKKKCKKEGNLSRIKIIFGPSKSDLRVFIHQKELSRLIKKKNTLETKIKELTSVVLSITEDKLEQELSTSNEVIKEFLNFSVNSNYDPEKLISGLLSIFRNTTNTDNVESKIKQDILTFFNEEDEIIDKSTIDTIKLLFQKLFMTILTEKEQEIYSIPINSIINRINIEVAKQESNEKEKEHLILQKKNIQMLQTYIKDGEITRTTDSLEEFKTILELSDIDSRIQEYLLNAMEQKIESEKATEEEIQIDKMLSKYLSEVEMLHIKKARELLKEHEGDIKNLIERAINDVISLCRYIDMTAASIDYQDSMDILTKRINILKELIINLEDANPALSNFYYLTGSDLIPQILRTIESYDITTYGSILHLLNYLASNKQSGELFYASSDIEIYKVSNESHTMLFSRRGPEIILINVYNSLTFAALEGELTSSTIKRVIEMHNIKKTKEFKKLQANYENLISSSLNLNGPDKENHQLKKER